jgi:hypothetical protein
MFHVDSSFFRIILLFLSLTGSVFAQDLDLNSEKKNSLAMYQKEIFVGFGGTQYVGDVGGYSAGGFLSENFGLNYVGFNDLNFKSTSFSGTLGYRYRFNKLFATVSCFNIGRLQENDADSRDLVKRQRNLHFRTTIMDYQQRLEMTILGSFGKHTKQIYGFGGAGVCYFKPKAEYNGEWVELKPLKTEGEGIEGLSVKNYSLFSPIVSLGFGFRYGIGETFRLGIEASYTKTFTDYIDDVSGDYVNPDLLDSEVAKYLSNPSIQNSNWFAPGQQRGNPKTKDSYFFLNITLMKNLTFKNDKKSSSSKKKAKSQYRRPI